MILSRKDSIVVGKKNLPKYFISLSLWMLYVQCGNFSSHEKYMNTKPLPMYHRHSQQSTGQREELGIVNVASIDIFQGNDSGRLLIPSNELLSKQTEFNIQSLCA